ncbi:MAG: bifunctional phosphoribosylaminoimidazolecarboxamide formyltransferase/IMP cyclohydrolase [Myxococcota bacterium]
MYALFSASDKREIVPFARAVAAAGYTILSTGGTARALRDADVPVTDVAHITGFPEILDGRVKTLHPKIHGGLLARRDDPGHMETLTELGFPEISVVVVNLYPFEQKTAAGDLSLPDAMEWVDIGGPTMIRAAAKNHPAVTVVTDPSDYPLVMEELQQLGHTTERTRQSLALKAFSHTARYDAAISSYMADALDTSSEVALPSTHQPSYARTASLRYGENPHQPAALYHAYDQPAYGGLEQLHGKALSYNNIVDLDAALALVAEFSDPAVAIIKHTNPAGCATGVDLDTAYESALASDPTSAFGGIVALNRAPTSAVAERIHQHFFEIVAAPDFSDDVLAVLTQKKNLRLMRMPGAMVWPKLIPRMTALGLLLQATDPRIDDHEETWEVVTQAAPDASLDVALAFAWRVSKHVKSNAVVLAQGTQTIGIGAGQMSRIDSVRIAVDKSRTSTQGSALASDAFFPFRDGVDAAAAAGVRAIVQPGGSRRDQEVIDACDEHGIAMVFTGHRHFRH